MTEEEDERAAQLREEQIGGCLATLPSKATMHLCLCCQSTFVQRHGSVPPLVCLTMPHNGGECPAGPHCPATVSGKPRTEVAPGPALVAPSQTYLDTPRLFADIKVRTYSAFGAET